MFELSLLCSWWKYWNVDLAGRCRKRWQWIKIKKGNPVPSSVKMYLLLCFLLFIWSKQKSLSQMVVSYLNTQNILQVILFWDIIFYMEKGRLNHISSIKSECKLLRRKKITYSVLPVTLVGKTDCETSNAFNDFSQWIWVLWETPASPLSVFRGKLMSV